MQRGEIRALTGLRGIAAALVAWGHFHLLFPAPTRITLFVDLFFMLSGFVIMLAYSDRLHSTRDGLRFLFLRLGRIYPLHLFTLAFAVLAIGYVNAMNGNPLFHWRDTQQGLIHNLFLVQAWPPIGAYSWNMPSWSISAEWAAYLLFPIMLIVSRYIKLWLIVPVLIGWVGFYLLRDGSSFGAGHTFGVHRCLLGFGLGMWLAMLRPPRWLYHDAFAIVAIIAMAAVWFLPLTDWWVVAPMALLVLNLSGGKGLVSEILSSKPVYGLGLISYSIYMSHYPIHKLWQQYHAKVFPNGMTNDQMFVAACVMIILVIAVSYAMWALVEDPARKMSKRLSNRIWPSNTPPSSQTEPKQVSG